MILLFLNEFASYREIKTTSQMYIDVNRGGDKLQINLDIELNHLPCSLLSIDVDDVMGVHSVNLEGDLMKYKLDSKGNSIGQEPYFSKKIKVEGHDHAHFAQPDYEQVKKQLVNNEGCRLKGFFYVNKVPGNFHISSHAFAPTIQRLAQDNLLTIDVNHKVNHLSFGNDNELRKIKKLFKQGLLNTLDGTTKNTNRKRMIYEYYIKIVPSTYINLYKKESYVYQYNIISNESPAYNQFPTLFFRYDISPITVQFLHYRDSFLNFFIQICAILGGVYTVTGIIDAMIHKSVMVLLRKAQRGKLG